MTSLPETKVCGMCCMEIQAAAKKCPYCQHWQFKLSMITFHPAFAIFFVGVPLLISYLLMEVLFQRTLDPGEDYQQYSDQIKVVQSELKFGQSDDGPTVTVLGRMENTSDIDWTEVNFAVEFLNEEDQLIDAGQEFKYLYNLPSHEKTAFKVTFLREFPESSYASCKIHVVSAKDAQARF